MTSDVTFPLTGYTFTLEMWQENDQRGHLVPMTVNGQSMIRLHALFEVGKLEMKAMIAGAGATVFKGTTATELTIGTGEKTFNAGAGKAFGPGARLQVTDAVDSGRFITGTSTAYDAETGVTTIVVAAADPRGGSGTISGANVAVVGAPGASTLSGSAVGPVDMVGQPFTAHLITHKTGTEHLPSATSTPTAVSGAQSLTLLSYTTHIINIDGDTTLTVSTGTTANHLTDCTLLVVNQGGWALTISGASELDGDTVDLTDMTTGQKAQFAFHMPADGAILYWRYGAYR